MDGRGAAACPTLSHTSNEKLKDLWAEVSSGPNPASVLFYT